MNWLKGLFGGKAYNFDPAAGGKERRKNRRVRCNVPIMAMLTNKAVNCTLWDISDEGMRLVSHVKIGSGTAITFRAHQEVADVAESKGRVYSKTLAQEMKNVVDGTPVIHKKGSAGGVIPVEITGRTLWCKKRIRAAETVFEIGVIFNPNQSKQFERWKYSILRASRGET